jgi:hypothetical protein
LFWEHQHSSKADRSAPTPFRNDTDMLEIQSQRLLISDATAYLRSLETAQENLQGLNSRGARQLCELFGKYFTPFFNELESDPEILQGKRSTFAGFETGLKSAVELLGDLNRFVSQFLKEERSTSPSLDRQFRTNARNFAEFNQRIHDSIKVLLPDVEIDPEEKRLAEMEEHITILLEDLFKDSKADSQRNHTDVMSALQTLTSVVNGLPANMNLLVESITNSRQGVSLESIYVYEPKPLDFDDDEHILGRGSFATTFRVKSTQDGQLFAMKQVKAASLNGTGLNLDKIRHEVRMLTYLNHDHIVRYFVSFLSNDNKRFNMVMELADGGSLALKVECDPAPSLSEIKKWLSQCLSALHYMHEVKCMWHRDIKPENILLTSAGDIKIADLGLACVAKSTMSKQSNVGTLMYASYEKADDLRYDSKDDIWGLGCVFVELITGKRLAAWGGGLNVYTNPQVVARKQAILQACEARAGVSEPALVASVASALHPDPAIRVSAAQWLEKLKSLLDFVKDESMSWPANQHDLETNVGNEGKIQPINSISLNHFGVMFFLQG